MELGAPGSLLLLSLGALIIPLLCRRINIPAAVGEIVYGFLVGPGLAGLVESDQFIQFLGNFGFLFLMFLAGMEIDFNYLEKQSRKENFWSFSVAALNFLLAYLVAFFLGWNAFLFLILGAASIGILYILLKELKASRKPFGQELLRVGSFGEILTIVLLGLYNFYHQFGFRIDFFIGVLKLVLVFGAVFLLLYLLRVLIFWFPQWFEDLGVSQDPAEIGIRAGFTLMLIFVAFSFWLKIEAILGAFLAGTLFSVVFRGKAVLEEKFSGVGNGFFIPFFFIGVGLKLRMDLAFNAASLGFILQFVALLFLVKLASSLLLLRQGFSGREILAAGLLLSCPISLLIAMAFLGQTLGALEPATTQSLVVAAVITGLLFPGLSRLLFRKTWESS